jgi:hypothetical protein
MLQMAERENESNKMGKEEEQEELEVDMLPKLFKYGLKMLENNELVENMQSEEEDEEYSSEEEEEEVDNEMEGEEV